MKIKCPNEGCNFLFTEELIKSYLNNDIIFQKYKKFYQENLINQDKTYRWCTKNGCDNAIKRKDFSTLLIKCDKCGTELCFQCGNLFHGKRKCEEIIDDSYKEYSKNHTIKNCPKCQSKIEKNEGCNHMTCVKCHYQFCWLCMRKYSSHHYSWWNICGCPRMLFGYKWVENNRCCAFILWFLMNLLTLILACLCEVGIVLASPFAFDIYILFIVDCCDKICMKILFFIPLLIPSIIITPISYIALHIYLIPQIID